METIARYALYFFFYSAVGWFVESCYCSSGARKWINRGFLTGPLCPIYGTGSLVFMVLVNPVKDWQLPLTVAGHTVNCAGVAVFFVGLILADIVEYTVSFGMEKLFHARWWDYTGYFLNLHGRICFKHSMYWGLASIVFLYLVHPFVDSYMGKLPIEGVYASLIVILLIFAVDVADAVHKAMDVRKLMDKLKHFGNFLTTHFGSSKEENGAEDDENGEKNGTEGEEESDALSEKTAGLREEAAKQWEDIRQSFERLTNGIKKNGEKYKNRMFKEFPMMRKNAADQIENFEKRFEAIKDKFRQMKK